MLAEFLKKFLPKDFKIYIKLILDYISDFNLYRKYSTVFSTKGFENKESILILNYHGIEKGLLHKNIKPRFAKDRIQEMHKLLKDDEIIENILISQIFIGYKVAIEYYELHKKLEVDISDYFSESQYLFYYNLTKDVVSHNFVSGVQKISFEKFYTEHHDYYNFSNSRKSVRNFTGEKIDRDRIKNIIKLSNNSPSVCNRQASKVYLLEDKEKIDKCLEIQGGFSSFTEKVNQLLILTVDRKYFYITGERYQFYIDGGIYLMNLLYALHFYKVAACPANWAKDYISENKVRKIVKISQEEQIICMIPIGMATDEIAVTLSYRRTVDEVLNII